MLNAEPAASGGNLILPVLRAGRISTRSHVEAPEKRISHTTFRTTSALSAGVVNGPGERETDIGFTGGGKYTHMVYLAGQQHHRLKDWTSSSIWPS
jgi:4-hydroxy-3-methylbut-2-en-1-yl diphosphate synthase IspG/GcpE